MGKGCCVRRSLLRSYVNGFNKHRIHDTLGYMTSVHYKAAALKKVV
ncbi:IS3 family transposase [Paenibacillus aquistagni]